jgi:hypothetical protein
MLMKTSQSILDFSYIPTRGSKRKIQNKNRNIEMQTHKNQRQHIVCDIHIICTIYVKHTYTLNLEHILFKVCCRDQYICLFVALF